MATMVKEKTEQKISADELSRRVAVLKRFRELLLEQRDRFREYLGVLDKQKDIIEKGNAEELISHVEFEENIVADIFALQKVIDPLEDMYRASYPDKETEVPRLKAALEELKNEAIVRSERNKDLLSKRLVELRSEIKSLRVNPYAKSRRSAFSDLSGSASMVDIKG